MSIASEITRINGNIAAAYTALDGKGATLPETQNSANLADTIDTITTGGGGNKFDEIDSIVSDAVTWFEGKSYKDAYDNGWLVASGNETSTSKIYETNANTVSGVVFSTNVPDEVYVKGRAFKAPLGSTISTNGLSNSICKIIFPNGCTDKWLVAVGDVYMGLMNTGGLHQIAFVSDVTNSSNCFQIADRYRYINIGLRQNTYTSQSPFSLAYPDDSPWQRARNLEGLKLSDNITFTLSTKLSGSSATFLGTLALPSSIDLKDFFEKHISDATYQTTALNTSISDDLIRSSSNMSKWLNRKDFPFIVDCSGFPSSALSNTWYMGYVPYNMASYYTEFGGFTDVKIKLPAMNIRMNYSLNRFMPIEYIRYMADNAPTVSGKTIKFETRLLAIINEVDSTIVSTFQSKGWTVS